LKSEKTAKNKILLINSKKKNAKKGEKNTKKHVFLAFFVIFGVFRVKSRDYGPLFLVNFNNPNSLP